MNAIGREPLEAALTALGELLAARGIHYAVVLIGGGNLILRGLVARPTTRTGDEFAHAFDRWLLDFVD